MKLLKQLLHLPRAAPVLDLALQPRLLTLFEDALLQPAERAAETTVLWAEAKDGAEVVGAITDVDNTVERRRVALEECLKFLS